MSLSSRFLIPSVQLDASQPPLTQLRLSQSAGPVQIPPPPQAGQSPPPQSMSVSVPFLTPSLQAGGAHCRPLQTPETQSLPSSQALPAMQSGQLPPQSTSVSRPLCVWSVQVGAWQ